MRRPIQISAFTAESGIAVLAVLCDDGKIFETWEDESTGSRNWAEIEGLPQDAEVQP